jgi:hypothetical protein
MVSAYPTGDVAPRQLDRRQVLAQKKQRRGLPITLPETIVRESVSRPHPPSKVENTPAVQLDDKILTVAGGGTAVGGRGGQ